MNIFENRANTMSDAKRMKYSKDCLTAVLADEITDPPRFGLAVVGPISDKKTLSKVLKHVGATFPVGDDHQYLKRVRIQKEETLVLIQLLKDRDDGDDSGIVSEWAEENAETASMFSGPVRLWRVPRVQARTRVQWEEMNKVTTAVFDQSSN